MLPYCIFLLKRLGTPGIGKRAYPLPVGDDNLIVQGLYIRGIPTYRNKTQTLAIPSRRYIEYGKIVIIGIGDI
jgi:hypothetical protein